MHCIVCSFSTFILTHVVILRLAKRAEEPRKVTPGIICEVLRFAQGDNYLVAHYMNKRYSALAGKDLNALVSITGRQLAPGVTPNHPT